MQKPVKWKRWLSYVRPLLTETVESSYSGTLKVFLSRGNWKLESVHAVYSFGRHYPPFNAGLKLSGYPRDGGKVLLLGVGTGSAVDILRSSGRKCHITAIDIDPVVLQLAVRYIDVPKGWSITYHCSDAAAWVAGCREQYDLIFADVFLHNTTPQAMQEQAFLEQLKALMATGGWLLYSKLHDTPACRRANKKFAGTFSVVFPEYQTENTGGNLVFAASS
jgi:spermidine synthase